ncbi:MAG: TlpA family protein disulfide reductase [Pyrinomonadaceae bacterium]
MLIANGFLIFQNLSLKSQLQAFAPKQIKEGNVFEVFQAKDVNGNVTKIDYDGNNSKRVLLYFHPTCGWCKKQMPYWKELVSNADPAKFKVTAVTVDDNADEIKGYMNTYGINSWDVLSIKKDDADKAELSGTPTTIVLDNKGKVEKVWVGMWRDKELADASDYFAIDFAKVETDGN